MPEQYQIIHYTEDGKDIFQEWLNVLRDVRGKAAIIRSVARMIDGNFGNNHYCEMECGS